MVKIISLFFLLFLGLLTGCHHPEFYDPDQFISSVLTSVAKSSRQWTGVAIERNGRLFANFPNWAADHSISVVELTDSVQQVPFPDIQWNTWASGMDPSTHFIAVQSVVTDTNNFLWVVDAANPQRNGEFMGVVKGGAKLVKINIQTKAVVQTIIFDEPVIKPSSYLNDVRIDAQRNVAYLTDSNEGALIVTDLASGKSRRLLGAHASTKSENVILNIDGEPYRNAQDEYPVIHADGLALSPDRTTLYWRALTAQSMFFVATADLLNDQLSEQQLAERVNKAEVTLLPADGMIFGPDGVLYMASVTDHAIHAYRNNTFWRIRKSSLLQWPDSFTISGDGHLYVTISQLNIPNPSSPYRIYKFDPKSDSRVN